MADMSVYDGIISPKGGLYKPGPEVVFPRGESDLVTRKVQTVAVDPFTGQPIVAGQGGNMPNVRAAMSSSGGARFDGRGSANLVQPNQPSGSIVADKSQERLGDNSYAFFGEPKSPALGAIDNVTTVAMPRKRPNIEANPGMRLDTGLMGVPMSQGMSERLAGGEAMGMVPGVSIVRNPRVFQALAAQQQAAPAPAAPAAPSQGTFVDPNTSTGSTLQGLGFSSGTVVPPAAIRNLTERGYL
jgi:hypothetical protein